MNLETKFRELDAAQKIRVCARLFQKAETFLGISKPMSESEKAAKSEQLKVLAKFISDRFGWLKIKAFIGMAENVALTAEIAHVTPKLFADYLIKHEDELRRKSADVVPELPPAPAPPQKTDEERLQELPAVFAQLYNIESVMFQSLMAQVYFPCLERAGLVNKALLNDYISQEIAANKARFVGDKADISTSKSFENFVKGIEGGIYEADAIRRAKFRIVNDYLKQNENE
jgi:hypothetical protein